MQNKIEFKVCNQGNNPKAHKECQEFIEKWKKVLGISEWRIDLSFLSTDETKEVMGAGYRAFL